MSPPRVDDRHRVRTGGSSLRGVVFASVLLGVGSLVGCGRRSSTTSSSPASTSTSQRAERGPAVVASSAATASVAPFVPKDGFGYELLRRQERELAALGDPLRLTTVDPSVHFRPWIRSPSPGAGFPGRSIGAVRAFAFGYTSLVAARDWPNECRSESVPEGARKVLAHDGTPCPDTIGKGTLLSAEQVERLVDLVRHPGPVERRWRCGYDPHHAFVLFDETDAPFAQVGACFTCEEWRVTPSLEGADATMGGRASDGLRQLCRELGLGGCGFDHDTNDRLREVRSDRFFQAQAAGDFGPEPAEPVPLTASGVDQDKLLAELDEGDRRKLCAVHVRAARARVEASRGVATACAPTRVVRTLDFDECLATFPRCDTPVYQAEACLRAMGRDPCYEGPACPQRDACLVGLRP